MAPRLKLPVPRVAPKVKAPVHLADPFANPSIQSGTRPSEAKAVLEDFIHENEAGQITTPIALEDEYGTSYGTTRSWDAIRANESKKVDRYLSAGGLV